MGFCPFVLVLLLVLVLDLRRARGETFPNDLPLEPLNLAVGRMQMTNATVVTQVSNPLYRRLPVGRPSAGATSYRLSRRPENNRFAEIGLINEPALPKWLR